MSEESVEIVRRAYAEFERGNFWEPDLFDPSVRIDWLDAVGAESETVGLQAMGEMMRSWLDVQEDMTLTAERIVDAGDRVVVVAVWRGLGRVSGVPTELRHGSIWTLRDGKVITITSYNDPGEALEAAGVPE